MEQIFRKVALENTYPLLGMTRMSVVYLDDLLHWWQTLIGSAL